MCLGFLWPFSLPATYPQPFVWIIGCLLHYFKPSGASILHKSMMHILLFPKKCITFPLFLQKIINFPLIFIQFRSFWLNLSFFYCPFFDHDAFMHASCFTHTRRPWKPSLPPHPDEVGSGLWEVTSTIAKSKKTIIFCKHFLSSHLYLKSIGFYLYCVLSIQMFCSDLLGVVAQW